MTIKPLQRNRETRLKIRCADSACIKQHGIESVCRWQRSAITQDMASFGKATQPVRWS